MHGFPFIRPYQWLGLLGGALLAAGAAVAQSAGPASDVRTDVQVRAGASRSDNVERAPAGEEKGTIYSAGLGLDVNRRGRVMTLTADADLDWMRYPDATFDSDVLGHLNALANFALVPDTFEWTAQDTFGQLRSDPAAPVTPDNLEDIHFFTTGPDFTLRATDTTSVRLSGRYSFTNSGANALDSNRYRADVALMRAASKARQMSLQVSGEQFKFKDAPPSADFDRYEAFVRYGIEGGRTDLSADLGYTLLEQTQGDNGGLLARISATRRLSSAAQLELSLGTQFSDAGDRFRSYLQSPVEGGQVGEVLGAADPFENRFLELAWSFRLNRTAMGVGARRGEELYQTLGALDRTQTAFNVYLERRMTPRLTARADARLTRQSFDTGFDDEELQAGAMLSWTAGRTLSFNLRYDRLDRDSSLPLAEYTENRLALFAVWSPLARR